ncbi:hypothetical protein SteCoe_37020 [Stentor coeruleus]|uniref:Uncharacterized protein n=1 Tax=Stentor coeruleus TaxID=5963 RepID=A0A1R2ANY2_9CILI|nr:hypothetical protein SteCoe_37020 [Stentor coeruleus]
MEDKKDNGDFLERTKKIREALKKKALKVKNGLVKNSKDDILDGGIKKILQSSLQIYNLHSDEVQNNSVTMRHLIKTHKEDPKKERHAKSTYPLSLPSIKRPYKPYLAKLAELPIPKIKSVKGYENISNDINPKPKNLNPSLSTIRLKKLNIR